MKTTKFAFAFTFFLIFSNLFCVSSFAGIFTLINPSSSDVAFGLDSGTSNIWNTSPLSVWSNPAKLGYHENFAFGYSNDPYFENIFDDYYIRSSYVSFGWKGIGIMFPTPSAENYWGTYMSYGKQEIMDEFGNVTKVFDSYAACSKFALGLNTLELISNFSNSDKLPKLSNFFDLSFGFNYDKIDHIVVVDGDEGYKTALADSYSAGLGLISRISPFNKTNLLFNMIKIDFTFGAYLLNPWKSKLKYDYIDNPLPYGNRTAFSGRISVDVKALDKSNNSFLRNFTDEIFAVYYSQDNALYGDKSKSNKSIWGKGIELNFFNIVMIRNGYHVDRNAESVGEVKGYTINLNYKNIFQFQYNTSEIDVYENAGKQNQSDFLIRFDLIYFYDLLL